jgi:anti-sigma B factor antagonist
MSDRPPELEIKQESRTLSDGGEAVVVMPVGDIDLATADEFAAALQSPRTNGAAGIVLDLRGVGFIDSSGLRVILIAAQELGERLATVITADSPVSMLVDLAEVADRVNPVSDEDEALARIERAGNGDAG